MKRGRREGGSTDPNRQLKPGERRAFDLAVEKKYLVDRSRKRTDPWEHWRAFCRAKGWPAIVVTPAAAYSRIKMDLLTCGWLSQEGINELKGLFASLQKTRFLADTVGETTVLHVLNALAEAVTLQFFEIATKHRVDDSSKSGKW